MVQHTDKDGSIANVMLALQAGHLTQAVALSDALIQALRAKGSSDLDLADAYHLRGMARRELGQLDAALEDMRRACEWDRANAMLWLHIGQVEQRMGTLAAAAQSLRRATQLKPALEEAWFALGVVLQAQQAWSEARAAFVQLLVLPKVSVQIQSIAHNHLGIALRHLEQLEASVTHFKRALELDPTMVEARLNLAQSYALLHRLPQAQAEIQRCVIQHPEVADVHVAWSEALAETDAPAALAALRRAVALQPAYRLRFARRIHRLERQLCDWSDFEASVAATLQAAHTQDEELGDLFITLSIPGFGRDLQRQRADKWALVLQREARGSVASTPLNVTSMATSIATPAQRDTRLRLGYLSADLHTHPTAWLMAEVFELHDRARVDVVAYSLGPDDATPMRQRLEKAFETFRDLRGMTLAEVDARIRADQLDILVDLKGYTQDARPEILALRPAPIQVSYLGYPATLGGDFMDYIIADEIVLPEAHQVDYSEKAVYLPQSYQCNDRQRAVADRPTRKAAGLPEQGVV
ncbi:MAG TPA: tetratricopeptide repeat protein, partial [bacterium]|nr:tetratricopeptide repeat protein [bacterium]